MEVDEKEEKRLDFLEAKQGLVVRLSSVRVSSKAARVDVGERSSDACESSVKLKLLRWLRGAGTVEAGGGVVVVVTSSVTEGGARRVGVGAGRSTEEER